MATRPHAMGAAESTTLVVGTTRPSRLSQRLHAPIRSTGARDGGAHTVMFLGIDPGQGGGIAVIDGDSTMLALTKMPEDVRDLLTFLGAYNPIKPGMRSRAMLEHVRSSPQMGVTSAFTFGRGVGHLEASLAAESIVYDTVTPRVWQKRLGIVYPKNITDTARKNITKGVAQRLFPRIAVTHYSADALLIAEFCRRLHCEVGAVCNDVTT